MRFPITNKSFRRRRSKRMLALSRKIVIAREFSDEEIAEFKRLWNANNSKIHLAPIVVYPRVGSRKVRKCIAEHFDNAMRYGAILAQ